MNRAEGLVAYFGHNCNDAAVRRRAVACRRAGFQVLGFMHHRGPPGDVPFEMVNLGETADNAYRKRVQAIFEGARLACDHAEALHAADVILARNLDMLATAVRVKTQLGLSAPLVFECLDIHKQLTGGGWKAVVLEALEARLLKKTALVAVSSPRFESEHFRQRHPGRYRHVLIENRLIEGDAFGDRPTAPRPAVLGRLRIGWFGNLRCRRSLDLLKSVATAYPDQVEIALRGYPALSEIPDLDGEIAPHPNITYYGRYRAPDDLESIYAGVDLIWAGDWYETGANSVWLLPNRIYEGGYFTTPALAPAGTETANWLDRHGAGLIIPDPVATELPKVVGALLEDPAPLLACQERLLALPRDTFVEPPELMHHVVDAARACQGS